jgi:putative aldouronate transport system substrate-binding protein
LWSAQLFWPDAPSPGNSRDNFVVGKFATTVDGYGNGWNDFWRRGLQNKPPNHFALITPFAATSGQKPLTFVSGGFISTNVLKAGPPERIKEVLRVIDFMAAPFGSQEDILLSYGLAPADYTLDAKGNPVLTDKSNPDAGYIPWRYICQHPQVSYQADIPGYAQACWDAEQAIIPISVDDPTQAFYSKTNFGGTATNARSTFGSGMNDIILGRRPMTDYDQLVKDWVSAVGDTIRKEYLDAMAAASK